MTPHWILVFIVAASGLLIGEIGGRVVRGAMSRSTRSPAVREMARPVGSFIFWLATGLGLLVAVAAFSPASWRRIPDRAADNLGDLVVALVFLIGGYALSWGLAAMVGQSALRASGTRHRAVERTIRWVVLGAAVALALGQLGVDTTVLAVVLVAVVVAPALSMALLTGLGGRQVAEHLAAGRALRGQLQPGRYLSCPAASGVVVEVHPVTVEVATDDGETVHVPLARLLDSPFAVTPVRAHTPRHN